MAKCDCVYEEFCSMLNGEDIVLPKPCEYRKDSTNFVEVVRCKDCKQYTPVEGGKPLCALHNIAVAHDDFCSYGERKDNERKAD